MDYVFLVLILIIWFSGIAYRAFDFDIGFMLGAAGGSIGGLLGATAGARQVEKRRAADRRRLDARLDDEDA